MVAAIGTGDVFSKGRDFGAWLGLVQKQISTGDLTILGSISQGAAITICAFCSFRADRRISGLDRLNFDASVSTPISDAQRALAL